MEQKPKRTEADENRRRNITVVSIIVMLGLFFAGFGYYNSLQNHMMDAAAPMILTVDTNETLTPTGLATFTPLPTYTSTLSPTAGPTLTPSPPAPNDNTSTSTPSPPAPDELDNDVTATPVCFFNWAREDAPEKDYLAIQTALDSAGYEMANVIIEAFGEDNICQVDGEVVSTKFLLMDITPMIIIEVDETTFDNPTVLGSMTHDVLVAIAETSDLPRISKIEFEFLNSESSILWTARYQDITVALTDEISDDALYELGIAED